MSMKWEHDQGKTPWKLRFEGLEDPDLRSHEEPVLVSSAAYLTGFFPPRGRLWLSTHRLTFKASKWNYPYPLRGVNLAPVEIEVSSIDRTMARSRLWTIWGGYWFMFGAFTVVTLDGHEHSFQVLRPAKWRSEVDRMTVKRSMEGIEP